MRFESIFTTNVFFHAHDVDFSNNYTVHGQLVISTWHHDSLFSIVTRLLRTKINFFVTTTDNNFHSIYFACVITLICTCVPRASGE